MPEHVVDDEGLEDSDPELHAWFEKLYSGELEQEKAAEAQGETEERAQGLLPDGQ